jgi:branched-chain amino acid transport system permease protein
VQQLLTILINGVTTGMIYAAFALALVLIWRSTRIVNFAQAPMAMITTYVALVVIDAGYSYWLGFGVALLSGLLLGALIERLVIRFVDSSSHINPVILTLGLFIIIHAVAAIIFGNQFRSFPAPFGLTGQKVGEINVALTGYDIFKIIAVLVVLALLILLFRFTDLGLKMRASAFEQEVAKLLGVRVSRMLTLG